MAYGFVKLDNLNRECSRASVPIIAPHGLRHTGISRMIKADENILTISRLAGHKDTATTLNVYGHLFKEDKRKAVGILQETYRF